MIERTPVDEPKPKSEPLDLAGAQALVGQTEYKIARAISELQQKIRPLRVKGLALTENEDGPQVKLEVLV